MSGAFGSSQWAYASGAGEAAVQQSLKFNDDENQYLSWTPAAAPTDAKTATWSVWVKRGNISTEQYIFGSRNGGSNDNTMVRFNSDNKLMIYDHDGSSVQWNLQTDRLFRDVGAWYHITVLLDTAQATSSDRLKLYINGTEETSFSTSTYPTQNDTMTRWAANGVPNFIGTEGTSLGAYQDGYLSDIYFIDGQALDASSFGQFTNGYWEKKDYAGTYGTNGFHLTFEDDVVSEGFNAVTYRGTGANQSISGLGFEPDFVWIKDRTDGTENHWVYDTIRNASIGLSTNLTDGEYTLSNALTSFDADGFSVGPDGKSNRNNDSYVAWAWDAGSGSPVSNTDGSITSTVKANPDYGFSIVSYTGNGSSSQTVGHGLGVAPDLLIMKNRDDAENWQVNHSSITDGIFNLNTTDSKKNHTTFSAGAIDPNGNTSTVFSMYDGSSSTNYPNESGKDYIAYCFNSVAGYSSFGSYSGNGSTSGPTITTGFRPAFVMVKGSSIAENWLIYDNTRDPQNPRTKLFEANLSNAERDLSNNGVDFNDTGFQLVNDQDGSNSNGNTYIYMAFADTREAAFWKDVSGQGNHWTPNNLDYRDSVPDSPTNNFATLSPLAHNLGTASLAIFEGNLKVVGINATNRSILSTHGISSGKWYFETVFTLPTGFNAGEVGFREVSQQLVNRESDNSLSYSVIVNQSGVWGKRNSGTYTSISTSNYTSGSTVVGVAFDADAGTFSISKDGVWEDNIFTSITSGTYQPFATVYYDGGSFTTSTLNFGQDSTFAGAKPMGAFTDDSELGTFQYQPPVGFKSLCSANLPEPTIIDGSEYFNTVLYTGDGSNGQAITAVGHQPDFVWIKSRTGTAYHELHDSVRGAGTRLFSNVTSAESTVGTVSSFDSDGFTVSRNSAYDGTNQNGVSFVGWNWKAGGTAVSNTNGSITSQVSANVDAGFSIVTWFANTATGTVGHGLNKAPELVIAKPRDDSGTNWYVMHTGALTSSQVLNLDNNGAAFTPGVAHFNSTYPTSSVISYGGYLGNALTNNNKLAYCFHSVDGYSKVGSYTGNGSSDGTFVYTGFRPAWVMVKVTSTSSGWLIWDNKRDTYNAMNHTLRPSSNSAEITETTGSIIDATSNGFKIREDNTGLNANGGTYIYLAFAETPQKFANAR